MGLYGELTNFSRFKQASRSHGLPLLLGFGTFSWLDSIQDKLVNISSILHNYVCEFSQICGFYAGETETFIFSVASGVCVAITSKKLISWLSNKYSCVAELENDVESVVDNIPTVDFSPDDFPHKDRPKPDNNLKK